MEDDAHTLGMEYANLTQEHRSVAEVHSGGNLIQFSNCVWLATTITCSFLFIIIYSTVISLLKRVEEEKDLLENELTELKETIIQQSYQ